MKINKIYQGDCANIMKQIPDNFVDLTITSPPQQKRNWLGIEISADYINIANKRIKHVQMELF